MTETINAWGPTNNRGFWQLQGYSDSTGSPLHNFCLGIDATKNVHSTQEIVEF